MNVKEFDRIVKLQIILLFCIQLHIIIILYIILYTADKMIMYYVHIYAHRCMTI